MTPDTVAPVVLAELARHSPIRVCRGIPPTYDCSCGARRVTDRDYHVAMAAVDAVLDQELT